MRLPETLLSHTLATYYHMPPCSSLVPRPCAFVLQATNAQGLGTRLTMLCVSSYFRQLIHMLYHTQKFICSSTPWFTKDRVEGGGGGGRRERGSIMQSCHSYLVCTWCAHSAAFTHTHTHTPRLRHEVCWLFMQLLSAMSASQWMKRVTKINQERKLEHQHLLYTRAS